MSEQDFPLPGTPRCNPNTGSFIDGQIAKIVSMDVYACGNRRSKTAGTNIVKISEANYRDNPDLCMRIVVSELLLLPAGSYTVVYHTKPVPCVMHFHIGRKRFGLRVKPLDTETINSIKHRACLRVEIE